MSQKPYVLALVKGKERYVFLYDTAHASEALRTLGRYASNDDLSFTWDDAVILSQKIRKAIFKPEPKDRSPEKIKRFTIPK